MNTVMQTTREGWLREAVKRMEERYFIPHDQRMPEKWAVSCGFPYGHARAIGQCWDPGVAGDGTTHMFVCPTQTDPVVVLATLLHEMIHAIVGVKEGHKKPFGVVARRVGLAGKLTATYAEEGSELYEGLKALAEELGPYPHGGLAKRSKNKRKAMGGWVRLASPNNPDYKVLVSPKKMEEFGAPRDPWGDEMLPVEEAE